MKVEAEAPARAATPGDGEVRGTRLSLSPWVVAAVVAVVVAGVVMRFVTLSEMWLDEALTVNISRLPLGDIPDWLRHDGAPPLYYFMVHVWTDVFGTSNFAVRSLSAVLSVAALPPMWFAGRRIAGRTGAWIALLVMASSPFAIQFGSEARMYSLMMLLVALGYLAVRRLLERPTLGRQAIVALITGLLLYTQYWAFYLIGVVGALLVWQAWRGRDADQRHAARAGVVALVAGVITFLPWVPTFLYQSAHTGTPWGEAVFVTASFAFALRDFAGGEHSEAYALLVVLIMLTIVAVFGRAIDRYRIELDVRTRPGARTEAFVWVATLVLGGVFAFIAHSTFAGRYASVLYPLFALVVAYGITVFADTRVRTILLAVVVIVGLVSGARNVFDDRTEAGVVAEAIRARARPGDVVLYCPDQLGPSVSRLLSGTPGLKQLTFPRGDRPELVDWVDYKDRRDKADPNAFARQVADRAGPGQTIWYVIAVQYRGGNEGKCDAVHQALVALRSNPRQVVEADDKFNEFFSLFEYPGR
ncbi:MAG TPA: glycosyltransferase family 39 protein [Acidimicrobiia bacterium]|nr:glycosyltransferase family 39 protein [Acidimicrobiia bacterium]